MNNNNNKVFSHVLFVLLASYKCNVNETTEAKFPEVTLSEL